VVAKGVRKLNSSRTASLEPGCLVDMFCLQSHGLPLVSQTKLIIDTQAIRTDLIQIKRFFQVLEIFDQLFVEESLDENTFGLVLNIHQSLLNHDSHQHVQSQLQELLQLLGFGSQSHLSISDQVSQLTNHKLHSFAFLTTSGWKIAQSFDNLTDWGCHSSS